MHVSFLRKIFFVTPRITEQHEILIIVYYIFSYLYYLVMDIATGMSLFISLVFALEEYNT